MLVDIHISKIAIITGVLFAMQLIMLVPYLMLSRETAKSSNQKSNDLSGHKFFNAHLTLLLLLLLLSTNVVFQGGVGSGGGRLLRIA